MRSKQNGPDGGAVWVHAMTGTEATWHAARNAPTGPFVSGAATVFPGAAERMLHDAAERAARHPDGRAALVLHLSRLRPPEPLAHHGRIARALLQDAAQRHQGHAFALGNGDLVLLCDATPDMLALPEVLSRLLRLDAPRPGALVSLWHLEQDAIRLLEYAAARLADRIPAATTEAASAPPSPLAIEAIEAALRAAHWSDLTVRRAAVLLGTGSGPEAALRPLFYEVSVDIAGLEARLDPTCSVSADLCLSAHLARRLDANLLAALTEELGRGGPLDATHRISLPFHLNLTPPTLLSAEFAAFARRCREAGKPLGAEVSLVEASTDPSALDEARRRSADAGWSLVLDGVSHLALLLTRPWMLGAEFVKLDWSPMLPRLAPTEDAELGAALRATGPSRIVLTGAVDEEAVRWGTAHGIRRFQGDHVDAMLAAARLLGCPAASGCSLRQCAERGAATGVAGRRFCHRSDLLDAATPPARTALHRP